MRDNNQPKGQSIYNKMFEKKVLMNCYRGSHSHGTYIKPDEEWGTDDVDTIVVYRYPIQYYLTLEGYKNNREVYEVKKDEIDEVGYEVRKMFSLLAEMNPNVINTLYMRDEEYIEMSPQWKYVRENREVFVGKRLIRNRFLGYAHSQLLKLDGSGSYRGYMGDKRKKMVDKNGYDTKNASHLVRLLRMGIEFLTDGEPQIWRPDRQELIDIKQGKWSLGQVQSEADRLFQEMERAYDNSTLPDQNNKFNINKLLYEVMTWED